MLAVPTGSSSATGNPRNRVALTPGHSLLDWIKLGKSGRDLTGVGGERLEVTGDQLAKHCTQDDAWTALKGNVYNITAYVDFHPGGSAELMRGAGIDCSELFDEAHKWVNYESMLSKCLVGRYVPSPAGAAKPSPVVHRQERKQVIGSELTNQQPAISNGLIDTSGDVDSFKTPTAVSPVPRYDWYQTDCSVTMVIYTRYAGLRRSDVIIELSASTIESSSPQTLHARVLVNEHTFHVQRDFEEKVSTDYKVSVGQSNGRVEVMLPKIDSGRQWSSLGEAGKRDGTWVKTSTEEMSYWACLVESVEYVTHDTSLYCVCLPDGARMNVPPGRHVSVTACVDGTDVVHCYTVIAPSLLGDHPNEQKVRDGRALFMMIKIYRDGILTPVIGQLRPDNCIRVSSSYAGDFCVSRLAEVQQLILFAAGTGFTPMAALITHCYAEANSATRRREVTLLFFNKTENDILWREQLDRLAATVDWFTVHHVLSAADDDWPGLRGLLREDIFDQHVLSSHVSSSTLLCGCGPTPFTQEFLRIARLRNFSESMIHAFAG